MLAVPWQLLHTHAGQMQSAFLHKVQHQPNLSHASSVYSAVVHRKFRRPRQERYRHQKSCWTCGCRRHLLLAPASWSSRLLQASLQLISSLSAVEALPASEATWRRAACSSLPFCSCSLHPACLTMGHCLTHRFGVQKRFCFYLDLQILSADMCCRVCLS